MVRTIELHYVTEKLHIGRLSASAEARELHAEVYRDKLEFRTRGSSKRYSYSRIKKDLSRK